MSRATRVEEAVIMEQLLREIPVIHAMVLDIIKLLVPGVLDMEVINVRPAMDMLI